MLNFSRCDRTVTVKYKRSAGFQSDSLSTHRKVYYKQKCSFLAVQPALRLYNVGKSLFYF